jgi:hypothetical protein
MVDLGKDKQGNDGQNVNNCSAVGSQKTVDRMETGDLIKVLAAWKASL